MSLTNSQVISLLEGTKKKIESESLEVKTGEAFEDHVFITMENIALNMGIKNIRQTGKQSFPDIVIGSYGVEVKFSTSNKWDSTGNSIFEGTYQEEVTGDIFVFFGKSIGKGRISIRYDNYENCLSDVKVTHSPRFFINMDQKQEKSIFSQLGIRYSEYRKLTEIEKAGLIKKYLKSKLTAGEKVWWMDDETIPVVREYRNLSVQKKKFITSELFVLFPELLSDSTTKYFGASVYLMTDHQLINSSLRDTFSAGGKVAFRINGELVQGVSKIYKHLFELAPQIKSYIDQADIETLKENWLEHSIVKEAQIISDRQSTWKMLINHYGKNLPDGVRASLFYEGGLGLKNVRVKC
jgi:hypothetical protein